MGASSVQSVSYFFLSHHLPVNGKVIHLRRFKEAVEKYANERLAHVHQEGGNPWIAQHVDWLHDNVDTVIGNAMTHRCEFFFFISTPMYSTVIYCSYSGGVGLQRLGEGTRPG